MIGNMLVAWLVMELTVNILLNIFLDFRKTTWTSFFKGVLERILLASGMLAGYPHIIIAFGALKIGTRIHEEKEKKISNDYFLIGNFLSILAVIVYVYACFQIFGWTTEN